MPEFAEKNHHACQRRAALALLLLCSGLAFASPGHAASYPVKPVRFIVPNGMGGSTDLVARSVAQKMSDSLGQQIVVDNRPGSGGILGTEIVARSAADGYTLLMGTIGNLAISPNLYKKLGYDPVRDFAPVTQLAASAYVLIVHPAVPAQSVRDFITLAKAKPGAVNYASAGSGTGSHLTMELFKSVAGIDVVHVPYKGGTPGLNDLIGGHVQAFFNGIPSTVPQVRANRLRALAVTTAQRSTALPEVPTLAEAGFAAAESTSWTALVVPAGTPRDIIGRLHREAVKALSSPETRQRLMNYGAEPVGGTPEQFSAYLKRELVKWGDVIMRSGARVN
ncbi:MAG: tripartite tricarboxylate transporter substrate binding protein [Betaproteobacteria bacterium]|nr:tripartite tricarboxylate transporter substrate binding protein [Betaproteobacteria bacterium]